MSNNIAVIGMGQWGKNLVRNFHELGVLAAICDRDDLRQTSVQNQYPGVSFCTNYQEVLRNPAIAAVAIATPAATHYAIAKEALAAGKDVFVEKPLALHPNEGAELVRSSRQGYRILMAGHILQYHPAIKKLKSLIGAGELGKIQYVYSNRLNIGKIRTEENILWSFAPHDISTILSLLDEEPSQTYCHGGNYLNSSIADVTLSEFLFPSGVRAHVFVSWLHPFKEQRLVVVGSEKMAVFDDSASDKLVLYSHRVEWRNRTPTAVKAEPVPVELELVEPLRAECQHFLDCIATRRTPLTDGEEALRVLRVLSACQKSLESQGYLEVKAEPTPYYVHPTARVDEPCEIGKGTKIWHFSHVLKGAQIGENCTFGQNCSVAEGVRIGRNVKVQNNVSIYTGTLIEDDVFLGPSCVLTNVTNPRSQVVRHSLYEKTIVRRGATIGANATIVCGVELGRYCFIGAGALVTKNVPDYALMIGNPARQAGWISRHGHRLTVGEDGCMLCPESGYRYRELLPGLVRCLDLDENAALPDHFAKGTKSYDDFKAVASLSNVAMRVR